MGTTWSWVLPPPSAPLGSPEQTACGSAQQSPIDGKCPFTGVCVHFWGVRSLFSTRSLAVGMQVRFALLQHPGWTELQHPRRTELQHPGWTQLQHPGQTQLHPCVHPGSLCRCPSALGPITTPEPEFVLPAHYKSQLSLYNINDNER